MKKITMTIMIALLIIGGATPGFAARLQKSGGASYTIIEGSVESLNSANSSFVIKDQDTGVTKNVYSTADIVGNLTPGDHVRVTLGQGSVFAEKVLK